MKLFVGSIILCALLSVLYAIQSNRIDTLERQLEEFETSVEHAFASHFVALEKTLAYQHSLENLFLRSKELRLTMNQIRDYNRKNKPREIQDEQASKVFQTQSVHHRTPYGTGAW